MDFPTLFKTFRNIVIFTFIYCRKEKIISFCFFQGSCARKYFDSTNLYNTYYQWVSIFLMIQAIIFYIPRCIWLSMEGGLMTFLVKGNQGRVIEDPQEKQKLLLKNYMEHVHNKFNKYAFCFFFCELLNILISISQVRLMFMLFLKFHS